MNFTPELLHSFWPVLLLAVVFYFSPLLTRRKIFLGATVNADFRKSADGHRLLRTYRNQVVLWTAAAIAVMFFIPSPHPIWRESASLVVLILGVWFSYWRRFREVHTRFGVSRPEGDKIQYDAQWKDGAIYWNPNDRAIFVQKRVGIGYTLNFANKWSWLVLLAIVALGLIPLFFRAR